MRSFNSHFHFDVTFFIKSKILKSSEWDTPPRLLRGVTTFLIYPDLFLDPPLFNPSSEVTHFLSSLYVSIHALIIFLILKKEYWLPGRLHESILVFELKIQQVICVTSGSN